MKHWNEARPLKAWAQAQQQYGAQHTAWEQARERATAHFETNQAKEPNMANNEHERKQQQQTQQQAQQATPEASPEATCVHGQRPICTNVSA